MPTIAAKRFAALDAIVQDALAVRLSGAVVRIEHEGVLLYEQAYGTTRADAAGRTLGPDTAFDLASLTKLFVATAALAQVSSERYALDRPLTRLFPEWNGTDHEPVTARGLLAHTAGFAAGADYRTLLDKNVEAFAIRRPLAGTPGGPVLYSDLGFITLGALVARAAQSGLARALAETLAPLRLEATRFRPARSERPAIPATEEDGWRGRCQGIVHDEKAYLMGGVAGHAGLFGTARDVARLTEFYLGNRRRRQPVAIDPALLAEALEEQAPDAILRRGLGWALKTSDDNSCGPAMSAHTFGHTGFTGTCVWADPDCDLSIVFLSNAVYFGRNGIRDLRAAVCTAAIHALRLQ